MASKVNIQALLFKKEEIKSGCGTEKTGYRGEHGLARACT